MTTTITQDKLTASIADLFDGKISQEIEAVEGRRQTRLKVLNEMLTSVPAEIKDTLVALYDVQAEENLLLLAVLRERTRTNA